MKAKGTLIAQLAVAFAAGYFFARVGVTAPSAQAQSQPQIAQAAPELPTTGKAVECPYLAKAKKGGKKALPPSPQAALDGYVEAVADRSQR